MSNFSSFLTRPSVRVTGKTLVKSPCKRNSVCSALQRCDRTRGAALQWKKNGSIGSNSKALLGSAWLRKHALSRVQERTRAVVTYEDPDTNPDTATERARKYRRVVFGGPEWVRHRSTQRYTRHIMSMTSSRVVQALLYPVSCFALSAGVVCFLDSQLSPWHDIIQPLKIPVSVFSLSGGALSLLLVFRTNVSYGRWWEARKIWGGQLNRSRDFVRQGLTWFSEEDEGLKMQLQRYTAAFAVALKVHLRYDEDMEAELKPILFPRELEAAMKEAHVPNHLLRIMSEIVIQAEMDPMRTTQMDENITSFEDALGKCERIWKTPVPISYSRLASRFLVFWLAFLPFALFKDLGWLTIPVEAMIALFLLGIKDIGIEIEEPFSILALEAICTSVANNTKAMLDTQERDRALVEPRGAPTLTLEIIDSSSKVEAKALGN
eukprot:CAMPEP_0196600200 /NCGR_PEP_ID=MMETSP1081-20130531/95261_1 /TAXON_ID=36882 /ORGANISM="Pyramimonas amylifera, Strain CCMP720" /LENGTH=434 /DNA_ID=CAMNT_0041926019 /DNA_START=40 /DNA_END=1344 /DNA_ORIENTATION=-